MSTPDVPVEAQEQVRNAVDAALKSPATAQGFLTSIPDLSKLGGLKAQLLTSLNTVIGALDTVLEYKWIIPDQYEKPLQGLTDALKKVKSWVA